MHLEKRVAGVVAVLFLAFLLNSCDNQLESGELTEGNSLLTLNSGYDSNLTVAQFFNEGVLFKVKKNPFSRKGYAFLGWSEYPDSNIVMYGNHSEMQFHGDKELYAVWELKHYSVSYDCNGGRRVVVHPETYTIESGTKLNEAYNGNYIFGGWYENPNFSGEPVTEIAKGSYGDKIVHARWCGKIAYHVNGGTLPREANPFVPLSEQTAAQNPVASEAVSDKKQQDVEAGKDAGQPVDGDALPEAAEVKSEHNGEESGEAATTDATDAAGTTDTLDAVNAVGSAGTADEVVAAAVPDTTDATGTTDVAVETSAADTANATGATDTADATDVADENQLAARADAVAEAEKSDESASISETENGISETDASVSSEGAAQVPAASDVQIRYYTIHEKYTLAIPEKPGYVFGGWFYDEKCTKPAERSFRASTAEITVYAKWNEIRTYAITYELGGGENAEQNPSSYKNSENALELAEPSRYGFDFLGWYESPSFSGSPVTEISAFDCGDKIFHAKWEKKTFTVRYCAGDATDGDAPKIDSAKYESAVSVADNKKNLSKDGCSFAGWIVLPDETAEDDADAVELEENEAGTESEQSDSADKPQKDEEKKLTREESAELQRLVAESKFVQAGEKYTVLGNVCLYPVWELKKYIVPKAKDSGTDKAKTIPNAEVTSVILPGYIKTLGNSAFSGFSSLKEFDFTGITELGRYAFSNCYSLEEVDLTHVVKLGTEVFSGCADLKKVLLPETLQSIGSGVFVNCPDGITFVTTIDRLKYYTELLTPAVVGKTIDTYTVIAATQK